MEQQILEAKKYISPCQAHIVLDNEMSLALGSSPPGEPGEAMNNIQNPYKPDLTVVK